FSLFSLTAPPTSATYSLSLHDALPISISLSVQQLVGVLMILFLTFLNTLGVRLGKLIQNIFTSAKTLSLVGLILLGIFVGRNAGDRKSTRLNSSHVKISYAVFCLKKKT